jgi:hypothetical protein
MFGVAKLLVELGEHCLEGGTELSELVGLVSLQRRVSLLQKLADLRIELGIDNVALLFLEGPHTLHKRPHAGSGARRV